MTVWALILHADREKDVESSGPSQDSSTPQKRSRPNASISTGSARPRHLQGQHAIARKLLPIDHSGSDRSQRK